MLLVYADDVNLFGGKKYPVKIKAESLTDAVKEVGLEVNAEKTNYRFLFRHQNARQNHDRSFENVTQFK
jgi:hypothetical protein